jgi:hypothetical protein
VAPDALILWARRLKQPQKALQISLDGVDWQPFLPFLTPGHRADLARDRAEIGPIEEAATITRRRPGPQPGRRATAV